MAIPQQTRQDAPPRAYTASRLASLSSTDVGLAVFTLARLVLVPVMIVSFYTAPMVMAAALALFIFTDIYDGVLARRFDSDGPARRALDSTVDRIGIVAVLIAAGAAGVLPLSLLAIFLVRDAYCALICARMMRRRRVAIKADWMYRTLNLSIAAWAVTAPLLPDPYRTAFAAVVLLGSLLVAIDLTRSVSRVLAAPRKVVNAVVAAGAVRRRVDWQAAISR